MKKNKIVENIAYIVFLIFGMLTIACVLLITVYLIVSGIPAIKEIGLINFLFGKKWASTAQEPSFGILPFILTSVYGTAAATVLAVPVGLLSSIYISRYANKKVRSVIESFINMLASIPSVVVGLIGMVVLVPTVAKVFRLSDGATLASAIVVDGSIALGATKEETIIKVTIPKAKSGIASAIVLAIGRAIGEAMAVVMVSGNVANMPTLFDSVRFLTTAISSEMSYASVGSLQRNALFSIALVLYVFIMLINAFLNIFLKKGQEN